MQMHLILLVSLFQLVEPLPILIELSLYLRQLQELCGLVILRRGRV